MTGTLALAGSGEFLPSMAPVDRKLLERLPQGARVACLPTAAGTEGSARIEYWSRLGVEHFSRLGARAEAVRVIDRTTAHAPELVAQIRDASLVYLSGGKPRYLFETLSGTPAWAAILEVIYRGGVVAGCSAGAMIMGERIPDFPGAWSLRPGFGLVPGTVIMPHFDEIPAMFARLLRALLPPGLVLLGVEAGTALVCSDAEAEVVGAGGVTVWDRSGRMRYTGGQAVSLPGHDTRRL